jgi:hypothetical protein
LAVALSHWRNLDFYVLLCRLVLQHGGTGQDAAADDNGRDAGRDNKGFPLHVLTSPLAITR